MVSILSDISSGATLAALDASGRYVQAIFDNSLDGILVNDDAGRYIDGNPAACALLGYTHEELIQLTVFDVTPEHDREDARRMWEQFLVKGSESGVYSTLRKDGSIVQLEFRAVANILPGVHVSSSRDVTESKRSEEALRQSESFRRTIIESEPECVKVVGADLTVLDMNPAGLAMIGASSKDQVIGKNVLSLIAREWRNSFVEMHERVCQGESVVSEFEIIGFNGKRRRMEAHAAPLRDLDSGVTNQLAIARDITERKCAEEALRQSEERYRELFENAKDATYVHDLSGRYTSVNRAAENLSGRAREEIIGRRFSDFVPPDHVELVGEQLCQKLIEEGETTYETEVRTDDGRNVPVEVCSHLIYRDGLAVAVQGTARDITERKRAEDALRQSERDYRGLFENAHDAIIIIHPEREIVLEVNQRACEVYGFSRAEFIGLSLETISKNVESGRLRIKEALEHGASLDFESIQRRRDGTEMFLHINASIVEYKGQRAIQSINRDITDRKRADEALRQSEERFSKAFHSSPSALTITLLEDGRLLEVNTAFLRMTGFSREEVIGRTTVELGLWTGHDRGAMAEALRERRAVENLEIKFHKKSGEMRDGLLSAELIQLGAVPSVLGIAQDVTERNRAEEALQGYPLKLIEAQEAERQLIARELHDQIGQVLTAIHLNLESVWETCESAKAKSLIDEGIAIVDEALGQVRDLSFELRPSLLDDLGLVSALRWYADRFSHRTGIPATTIIDLPESAVRLKQELETACFRIVQEALTNVVRHARARSVSITLGSSEDLITLAIKDDGAGFDGDSQNIGAFNGCVGLRGMRERARALGGQLDVRSAPSQGTEIRANFPKASNQH